MPLPYLSRVLYCPKMGLPQHLSPVIAGLTAGPQTLQRMVPVLVQKSLNLANSASAGALNVETFVLGVGTRYMPANGGGSH